MAMATPTTTSAARPGARAHLAATKTGFPELVSQMTSIIGKKLTAYIAGKDDVRSIDRWMQGQGSYKDAALCLSAGDYIVGARSAGRGTVLADWYQPRAQRSNPDSTLA